MQRKREFLSPVGVFLVQIEIIYFKGSHQIHQPGKLVPLTTMWSGLLTSPLRRKAFPLPVKSLFFYCTMVVF